jgi:two-component system sensor histidine kinase KdpD
LPDAARESAAAIREQALQLSGQVHKLLDMARLQTGKVVLNKEWQPLEEVVGSSLHALAGTLAGREVRVELAPGLPPLEFDAVLLERVFCNLLENAAKYSPEGARS